MTSGRLQAPPQSGATLAHPPLADAARLIGDNRARLDGWHYDLQGRSIERVRGMSRGAAVAAATPSREAVPASTAGLCGVPAVQASVPLILSGHQPELFHPGVWIKNFVSHWLARRCGGLSMHLIVDNDTVKSTSLRVPTGTITQPALVHVPLDRWRGEIPYEEYRVADEGLFASFGARLAAAVQSLGIRPLAADLWSHAVAAGGSTNLLSDRIGAARRWQESAWGCHNVELPVSRLCQSEGFLWFACHILAQIERFRVAYNDSLEAYRRRNRIRSRNHPVPALARDDEWLEAPFWIWSSEAPRRRRLFVAQRGRELAVTDRDGWNHTLPLAPDRDACCAVEQLHELAQRGIRIRTRALSTTIFTRLCLADLFIHGLGGARYDELTDEIVRRFFDLDPPRFLTLTGTLRLPVATSGDAAEQLRHASRRLRHMIYHPDQYVTPESAASPVAHLIEAKRRAVGSEPATPAARHDRFLEIRRINEQLAPLVADQCERTERHIEALRGEVRSAAILNRRDWPFCAYPAETLRAFVAPFTT